MEGSKSTQTNSNNNNNKILHEIGTQKEASEKKAHSPKSSRI